MLPFEISDDQKIKKMIRKLRVARANLSISKMNIDFHLRIINNNNKNRKEA